MSPGQSGTLKSVIEDGKKMVEFGRKYNFEVKELFDNAATPRAIERFLTETEMECYEHEDKQLKGKFLCMIYYSGFGTLLEGNHLV